MTKDNSSFETLQNNMYTTKAARFNADERLRFTHKLSHYGLVSLSIYIVAITVSAQYTYMEWLDMNDTIFWSFMLSIALLGIAAFEANSNRLQQAYSLHANALKINELYRDSLNADESAINDIQTKYTALLESCPFTHTALDSLKSDMSNSRFSDQERAKYKKRYKRKKLKLYGLHYLPIVAPPILFFFPKIASFLVWVIAPATNCISWSGL